jgi:hypothetical protein
LEVQDVDRRDTTFAREIVEHGRAVDPPADFLRAAVATARALAAQAEIVKAVQAEMQMVSGKKIGVISDTHGLLRPEAVRALRDCERIVHAGDVGDPAILDELERLAPVAAVRGNVDRGAWAEALPETEVVEVGSALLYVLHDLAQLDLDPPPQASPPSSAATPTSRGPRSARACSTSTPEAPAPGDSSCR